MRTQARAPTQHYAESVARRQRVLTITAWLAVVVTGSFALMQLATGAGGWYIALINVFTAVTFAIVPLLHRFGGLVAPLTFIGTAYVAIFAIGWDVGTDAGAQFFFLVAAALVVLLVGIQHTALAVGGGRRRSGDCPGVPGPARYWASAALGHVGKFRPHDRLRLRGSGRNGVVRAA